jgi:tetratricopeptide (TPR) repeat protein
VDQERKETHLSVETMARWLSRDLDHETVLAEVVPHVLAVCPGCRESYEEVLRLQREYEHWDERVAVLEGRQAPLLFAELAPLPFEEQLAAVRGEERFQNWGLCQLLLRESLEAAFEDPTRAISLAELGVRITEFLVEEAYDPEWVLDLRARAWAYLGNGLRVLGELWSAESAFRRSEEYLEASMTGNPHVRAEVLDLKGSLRRAQRRLEEAEALAGEALSLYRESEDLYGVGAVLIKQAKIFEEQGLPERAIALLEEAAVLAANVANVANVAKLARAVHTANVANGAGGRKPRLLLCARHNLAFLLTTAERYAEAAALLPEVRRLSQELGNPLDLVRLRWVEGRIALGTGEAERAEAAFREVQGEFFERHMGYDAALVSLDLAVLYAEGGRAAELKALAVEIMPVFESREVNREAMAALLMFQHAAQEERLTADLARQLAAFLKRERRARR